MKIKCRIAIILAALSPNASVIGVAYADPVIFNFSGVFDNGADAGSTFSGTIAYDTSTPTPAPYFYSSLVHRVRYDNAFTISNLTRVLSLPGTTGIYSFDTLSLSPGMGDSIAFNGNGFSLDFDGPFTSFSSNALPTFNQLLGLTKTLTTYDSRGSIATGSFQITQVAGAIPEPAAWSMLILGFGLTGVMLRRSQTSGSRVRFV